MIAASAEFEKSEEGNVLPDRKRVAQLVQPGSSLGGARPKASVIDTDETLYIAELPSRKDDYDAGLWEHFSHLLAIKAGINAAKPTGALLMFWLALRRWSYAIMCAMY